MFVILPNKKEWLVSLMKEFDVISFDAESVRMWWDCDILDLCNYKTDTPFTVHRFKASIRFEGIMTWEEVELLKARPYMYIESIVHVYKLEEDGFFGGAGESHYDQESDAYYVHCYLSDACKEDFLQKEVIAQLKDVRLRELIKREEG